MKSSGLNVYSILKQYASLMSFDLYILSLNT